MGLIPEDDFRHAHGPAQRWSESVYFNFFDSEGGLGGFIRIAFSPASGVTDGIFVLWRGNGKLLLVRTYASWSPVECAKRVVAAGALTARGEEPLARWMIAYDGDVFVVGDAQETMFFTASGPWMLPTQRVSLALSFEAFHPAFLFPRLPQRWLPLRKVLASSRPEGSLLDRVRTLPQRLDSAVAMRGNHHFEQAGHWRATIEIDAERFDFAGSGMRDRSRGIRDWRVFSWYRSINAQFGEPLAFTVIRMRVVGHEALERICLERGPPLHAEGLVTAAARRRRRHADASSRNRPGGRSPGKSDHAGSLDVRRHTLPDDFGRGHRPLCMGRSGVSRHE
jgi:hypothetical protein